MARSDWAALLAAAVQIAHRHDTRPFLPLVKGLARQTNLYPNHNSMVTCVHDTPVPKLMCSMHLVHIIHCRSIHDFTQSCG